MSEDEYESDVIGKYRIVFTIQKSIYVYFKQMMIAMIHIMMIKIHFKMITIIIIQQV